MKKPRKHRPRRLQYESLEAREVMTAGLTATLNSSGVLTIAGTAGNDGINFRQNNGVISVQDISKTWTSAKVKAIVVDVKGGNDAVSIDSFANGGNQAIVEKITVRGGLGTDVVNLGGGKNVNVGGGANTLVIEANGAATLNGVALNLTNSVQMSYYNGVLTVTGTNNGDNIKFVQGDGWIGLQGGTGWYAAGSVTSVVVNLQDGSDNVSFDSLQNGGNQAITAPITVRGGSGTGNIRLPNSIDTSISGVGNTFTYSGGVAKLNGSVVELVDEVQWSLSGGVLTITGKRGDDVIYLRQNDGYISVFGQMNYCAASAVNSIVVNLRGGTDFLCLYSIEGGGNQELSKQITVNATGDWKWVRLPNGETSVFGAGSQLKVLSSGAVTLNGAEIWPSPNPPSTNWFDANVQDAALRALGHDLYTDSLVNRSDIISLLRNAEDGGIIDATELADLRLIAGTASLFGGVESLQKLTSYVVTASYANRNYLGQTLGNLGAGSATAQMEKLINKWYFGLDRPTAGGTYRQVSGQLFVNGAAYTDVYQGAVGDCYFVSSLAETAFRNASSIASMFTTNGDGTYTVRFYNGAQTYYVSVDSYLPTHSGGQLMYAGQGAMYNSSSNELWVALAEKAYAQLNEFGFSRSGFSGSGQNTYDALNGGYIYSAQNHITGLATSPFTMTSGGTSFTSFVNAFNAGKQIGFASYQTTPQGSGVVGSHAYAVVGYNASNQTVTLFNPWGINYGLLNLTWSQVQASFMYFDRTA